MTQTIEAIYEDGVFKPLGKVLCAEHLKVIISILAESDQVRPTENCHLDEIVDIAQDCSDTDLSTQHDRYLYGEIAA